MSKLVQIMRTLRSMPPLPDVASRVLSIVRNPEYSIDALVAVVRTDPALTTRILKLCNSSLFGLSQEITSVSDAVAYLGSRNLVKLVLVSCTASYFKNLPPNPYADPTQLWRQTLACSTACQALAERCGHGQPATAFTVGILHNVGRIAMVQVVDPETLARAARELMDPAASPLEVERRVIGLDHAAASGIVTESWNLPMELRRAARNHHDVSHLASDDDLTALLHVADETIMSLGIGELQAERPHAPAPMALQRLRLTNEDVEAVKKVVEQELDRIGKLLNPEPQVGR
ncbi:MAG: HDOD domain-containing protein [Planctomycetota bacterium]